MADVLLYDPASEFEVLETIDFQEEIQRPEEVRFFTLDEQLLDYFEKVLPKKKNITKFEYEKIAKDSDRIRELYLKTVTLTDTDYTIDLSRKTYNIPWIHPIYEEFKYNPYSFKNEWLPVNSKASRSTPNFYTTMISALPKPYHTIGNRGTLVHKFTIALNEDGVEEIRAQGNYNRTKTVIHEDSSYSIIDVPVGNTSDDIRVIGFYMSPRGIPIPNPMEEHPFLNSSGASKLITDEPLNQVYPSTEAILNHAVPVTEDPYGEGMKYLKLYDVNLRDIPWSSWKDRFPPASLVSATPSILSVPFPNNSDDQTPAKSLLETYVRKWNVGVSPRTWLLSQEDGGWFVARMLLSQAGLAGLVPPEPFGEKLEAQYPSSTPEECLLDSSFDAFLNSGVFRDGKCVPSASITQERSQYRSAGKIPWRETTDLDILKEHQKLLKAFQIRRGKETAPKYDKHQVKNDSDLRKQIIAILEDNERTDEDKLDATEKIVRELSSKNKVYTDSDGLFVLCEHTKAILHGDLENDRLQFYDDWTGLMDGFRCCKFCGEQINSDVLVAQDDFDENGHVILSHDVLPTSVFKGESTSNTFANSLRQLQSTFILTNTGESILYLLLSVLQIIPEDTQLLPVLDNIRTLTAVLKSNKKISQNDKDRIEGILGIIGMLVLLQTHNPFLLPRRSFGSRILKFSGFPRDTDDPTNSVGLDTIISVLKSTFESLPTSFKGPSTAILRAILSKPKEVRKEAIIYIKQAYTKFKSQFESAKQRYIEPEQSSTENPFLLPVIHLKTTEFKPSQIIGEETAGKCATYHPKGILIAKLPPSVTQKPMELWSKISVSKHAKHIIIEHVKINSIHFTDSEIRRRIEIGFSKSLKLPRIESFLRTNSDGIAFLSLLSRIIDILSAESFDIDVLQKFREMSVYIETEISTGLVRDSTRGLIYELFDTIQKHKNKTRFLTAILKASQKDLVMNMILLNKEDAEKTTGMIRARERDVFKQRLRQMNDTEREITKMLLDIGIAPYLITNEDREIFAKEFGVPDPEEEYAEEVRENDEDMPEEGYNALRDNQEDGDVRVNQAGQVLEADYGDYGDRVEQRYDREYDNIANYDADEGFGV